MRLLHFFRRRGRRQNALPPVHALPAEQKARHYLALAWALWKEDRAEIAPASCGTP